jgi:hypothetical protein
MLWFVIPDGDRRHGAQSGGVEHQIASAIHCHDDVVGILVLGQNLVNGTGGSWVRPQSRARCNDVRGPRIASQRPFSWEPKSA